MERVGELLAGLRGTRALPLALVALAAAAAIPVAFLRPAPPPSAAAPAPTTPAAAAPAADGAATATAATGAPVPRAQAGRTRNPFRPLHELRGAQPADGGGGAPPAPGAGAAGGGSASLVTGAPPGGAQTGGEPAPKAGELPGLPANELVPIDRVGEAPAGEPADALPGLLTHVVDVALSNRGRHRRFDGVERMRLIPSRRAPLAVYLGVTPSRRSAVFMVSSELRQAGEGQCLPSPELCTFLLLRVDARHDEHFLREPDGRTHRMRLHAIRRVPASAGASPTIDPDRLPGAPDLVDDERR